MSEVVTEKCAVCNGSGKEMKYDNEIKLWSRNGSDCEECNGAGVLEYEKIKSVSGFLDRKIKINNQTN